MIPTQTNSFGEAFRLRGISRRLVSRKISTRFQMRDEKKIQRTILEIMQRMPGEKAWTSVKVYRPPFSVTNDELDGIGIFLAIENVFIADGTKVLLRFVVPPDAQWDSRGQPFTLYLAELRGVTCPLEIYENFQPFCK